MDNKEVKEVKKIQEIPSLEEKAKDERIIGGVKYERNYASGDYSLAHLTPIEKRHLVPLVEATAENLDGYGFLVDPIEYSQGKIKPVIRQWPQENPKRPIAPGTGMGGGTIQGKFKSLKVEDYYVAENTALGNKYIIGREPVIKRFDPKDSKMNSILVREANFHPDGGQIMCPLPNSTPAAARGAEFILLLAKPTYDVKPEDFRAFLFKGNMGFHINPGCWHKPLYRCNQDLLIFDEQGAVHAVVCCDIFEEFGKYLEICF